MKPLDPHQPLFWALAAILGCFVLWLAYRIGKVVLRIAAGLAVLALVGWGFWHFLLK